jgi:ABC-2 type transport system permease protein
MSAKVTHLGPLRREATKLRALKRTYWGGGALLVIPFLIALIIHLSSNSSGDQGGGAAFPVAVFMNGLYVAPVAIGIMAAFLLPLAAAMVGGYMVAGEAEAGTLRTILVRPVRRGALLLSKWATAVLYLGIVMLLIALVGVLSGWAFFGIRSMLIIGGEVGVWHGLFLILLTVLYELACMTCVISIALLFSTLIDSSLVAAVLTIALTLFVQIVLQFNYFKGVRPYWFMNHFDKWTELFKTPTDWTPIRHGLIAFAAYSAVPVALAYLRFRRKDITS